MYSNKEVAYVVFNKGDNLGWIRRLIHPYISHCYVARPDNGSWLITEGGIRGLSSYRITSKDGIMSKSLVVKVNIEKATSYISLTTCVSDVKRVIGLKAPFVFTPYQLYKRLTNGKLTKKTTKDSSRSSARA